MLAVARVGAAKACMYAVLPPSVDLLGCGLRPFLVRHDRPADEKEIVATARAFGIFGLRQHRSMVTRDSWTALRVRYLIWGLLRCFNTSPSSYL